MKKTEKVVGQAEIQKRINDYRKKVSTMGLEELEKEECAIIEEIDKHNKYVSTCKLKLPENGRKVAFTAIQSLLDRQKMQWTYAIMMAKIYKVFDPDGDAEDVEFNILDTMLRTLSSLEYTGYEDWHKCELINDYFEPIRDEYVSISERSYELAEKHVVVDETMRLFGKDKKSNVVDMKGN